jgi:regulatory protein
MPSGILFLFMDTITSIKFQSDFIRLLVNETEVLDLSYDLYFQYKLDADMELTPELYEELKLSSQRFRGLRKALGFLSYRSRSQREIEDYLKKKQIDDEICYELIEKLENMGYIDDHKFALQFIQYKMRQKPIGIMLLKKELYKTGIIGDVCDEALEETGAHTVDFDRLLEFAQKKYNSISYKNDPNQKLYRFLAGRGFLSKDIQDVIKLIDTNVQ